MKSLTLSLDISTTATGWAVFHGSDLVQICWDKLSITKKEVNYILGTAHGIYSKKIEVDATLSGMITEVIQNRIEMLKQELVELGVEMEELEDDGRIKAKS